MTISQTVEIPVDRRLIIDVPREIPAGATARFKLIWFPVKKTINNLNATLETIQELCKDSSITVDSFLQMRHKDKELEEKQYRKLFTGDTD